MSNEVKMWNGGTTNKYDKMIRESEDYYDVMDSEVEFREDLVKREKLMRMEKGIESKYRLTREREDETKDK